MIFKTYVIDIILFYQSCESENDEDWVEIKHARTGAAKKKKKKDESEDEDETFACKKCGK